MTLKMMKVQKLLIAKTEECTEKDLLLQQKDQINAAMKTVVASRPGPEVSNQLSLSKHAIRCKNHQLQVCTSINIIVCRVSLTYVTQRLSLFRWLLSIKLTDFISNRNRHLLRSHVVPGADKRSATCNILCVCV